MTLVHKQGFVLGPGEIEPPMALKKKPTCFKCPQPIDDEKHDYIFWAGQSGTIYFHIACALDFGIRFMADVHQATHISHYPKEGGCSCADVRVRRPTAREASPYDPQKSHSNKCEQGWRRYVWVGYSQIQCAPCGHKISRCEQCNGVLENHSHEAVCIECGENYQLYEGS